MRLTLEVESGPGAPRSVAIEPGPEVRVGRSPAAGVVLPDDRGVSHDHFALAFDGRACRVRDLGGFSGTWVNGVAVTESAVTDGDVIRAGRTTLRVRISVAAPAAPPESSPAAPDRVVSGPDGPPPGEGDPPAGAAPSAEPHGRVIEALRASEGLLYAVLDAARDPLVLARLFYGGEEYRSLYEGAKGERLAAVAPYLVALPPGSPLLTTLVREGWGKSWGVYLTSDRPFAEVRSHLRRSLTVEVEGGKALLFRFYDPRVLRVYLPTCTPEESAEFFGPVRNFLLEGESPETLLVFPRAVLVGAVPGGVA